MAEEDSQTSLVTIDNPDVNSIRDRLPEDTLLLLLKFLPTDQVTTILDTGYTYPGTNLQRGLRVRSLPNPSPNQLHQAETIHSTSEPGTIRSISNALEMAQVVLQDIHQASQSTASGTGLGETYVLNVNAWTTFGFVYQVG